MTEAPHHPQITAWTLWRRNGLIWAALMGLLLLTLTLAYQPMGWLSPTVALLIASAKAALVAALFMELAGSKALNRLASTAGLVFVAVLFALTLTDVLSRLAFAR